MSLKTSESTECVTPWAQENSVQDKTLQAQSAQVFFSLVIYKYTAVFKFPKKKEKKNGKRKSTK